MTFRTMVNIKQKLNLNEFRISSIIRENYDKLRRQNSVHYLENYNHYASISEI